MTMKTVITLMALAASLLVASTFGLHEYVISADDAQIRRACRHLCRVSLSSVTGENSGVLGRLTNVVVGAACESLEDEAPEFSGCRGRLEGQGITVATYRCVMGATSEEVARACGDGIL